MKVIGHSDPKWHERYLRHGRENGAATYSREIVEFQVPVWASHFYGKDVTISTCPLLDENYKVNSQIVIQYLHRYPYDDPLKDVRRVLEAREGQQMVFVTTYKQLHDLLYTNGIRSIFMPMSIDAEKVQIYRREKIQPENRIAYFGNLLHGKEGPYLWLVRQLRSLGYTIDAFHDGVGPDGKKLTQEEAWARLSEYHYGIGVGRCALEMYALGLKVLIAGKEFGGIVRGPEDWLEQQQTNFNGRRITYDRDIRVCMEMLSTSISFSSDYKDAIDIYLKREAAMLAAEFNKIQGAKK